MRSSCRYCSTKYYKKKKWQLYCSKQCKIKHYKDQKLKPIPRRCKGCDLMFTPKVRVTARYCSSKCSTKDWRDVGINNKRVVQESADAFSRRWELLWKLRPDLHEIMVKIENRVKIP